jgi:minor curlin subunit
MLLQAAMQAGAHAASTTLRWKTATLLGLALCFSSAASYGGDLAMPELTVPRLSAAMANSLTEADQPRRSAQASAQSRMIVGDQARRPSANDIATVETGRMNVINATQSGTGNTVTASQAGKENALDLYQGGDANSARLTQQGGNRLALEQVGMGNRADIQQINGGPAITIRQTGGNSFIKAIQY